MIGPALAALLVTTLPLGPRSEPAPAVLVTAGERFGAGVVWDAPRGLVLTALHVVEGGGEIRVSLGGAPSVPARVVDRDPALDLALLAGAPLDAAGRATPTARAACGARVRLLGFPRLAAAAVEGIVVDPARRFAGARYVEIDGRAEPGASGGPVVDAAGAIVGIVDLVLADRGVTLAVPIELAAARFPSAAPAAEARATPPVARVDGSGAAARTRQD